jgi:hypothetical protein
VRELVNVQVDLVGLDHRRLIYHGHDRDERHTCVHDAKVIAPLVS